MSARADFLRLDSQLCFALYRASRAIVRAYAPLLEPLGLTYPQYLTLLVLWEEEKVSMKGLGRRLTLDSATLTPLLKRLEQQGLVARERSTEDERLVLVTLTKRGRALRLKARGIPSAMACKVEGSDEALALVRIGRLRDERNALVAKLDLAS